MPEGIPAERRTCAVCDRPWYCRDWCSLHYTRWLKRGDPLWEPAPLRPVRNGRSRDAERSAIYRERHPGVGQANSARWRAAHPEGKGEQHRLARYGLSAEQYASMLESQGGCCAICGTAEPGWTKKWPVDHDHSCCPGKTSCGKCVRGLVCHTCNRRLEALEAPGFAKAAATYLARFKPT